MMTNDFHYLIEIAVNLNTALENHQQMNTPLTRKDLAWWRSRLRKWIAENYEKDGINKRELELIEN